MTSNGAIIHPLTHGTLESQQQLSHVCHILDGQGKKYILDEQQGQPQKPPYDTCPSGIKIISPTMESVVCQPNDALDMIHDMPNMIGYGHGQNNGDMFYRNDHNYPYEYESPDTYRSSCVSSGESSLMTHDHNYERPRVRRSAVRKLEKSEQERKEAQRLRNRISAQNHRDRQKRLISNLHNVVEAMRGQTERLEMELLQVHETNSRMTQEMQLVQEVVRVLIDQLSQLDPQQGERAKAMLQGLRQAASQQPMNGLQQTQPSMLQQTLHIGKDAHAHRVPTAALALQTDCMQRPSERG